MFKSVYFEWDFFEKFTRGRNLESQQYFCNHDSIIETEICFLCQGILQYFRLYTYVEVLNLLWFFWCCRNALQEYKMKKQHLTIKYILTYLHVNFVKLSFTHFAEIKYLFSYQRQNAQCGYCLHLVYASSF